MYAAAPFSAEWLTSDAAGLFTAALAVVAVVQAGLFVWQLVLMRKTMQDSTVAAKAAEESARVAREAFTKMERPYLYIFGVKGPLGEFEVEEPYDYFEYHVANYGKTPAKVENALFSVSTASEPERPKPTTVWHELLRRPILIPGELREEIRQFFPDGIPTRQYADEDTPPGALMEPLLDDGQQLFFLVMIGYRGPFSEGHETSGCWRWDRQSAKMIEYGGDEYNYTR
jgi:hypothetical protein